MTKPPVQILLSALSEAQWPEEGAIYARGVANLLDMENEPTQCAWCMDAAELAATQDSSHGICQVHRDAMVEQARARRAARVA